MTRLLLPAFMAAAALAAPAHAQDSRLVELMYDPAKVVVIEGKTTVQATIAFEDDERIENVAIGDSRNWQVTPNKRANLLFVKPLVDRTTTNMTVVTNRRTYLFDLVARPNAEPLYVLRFDYPEEESDTADEPLPIAQRPNSVEMAAANDPYAVTNPAELNFEWRQRGDAKLLPMRAYDDGEATFLTWANGRPIPAILTANEAGLEGPVNYAVRGDTIVVDGVPKQIILRSGDDMATLDNEGPARSDLAMSGSGSRETN